MAKSVALRNLKIGDVVLLQCNPQLGSTTCTTSANGFIVADLSNALNHTLLTVIPEVHDHVPRNIESSTFQIQAASKYKAQNKHNQLKMELQKHGDETDEAVLHSLKLQLLQAEKDRRVEEEENNAHQHHLFGHGIQYGDTIQLRHTLTLKYISVVSTQPSVTEKSKLMVCLQDTVSAGCMFRIQPFIQVETLGNQVHCEDQIKFESMAMEWQFLHCSTRSFAGADVNIFSGTRYELNISSHGSPWKVLLHYQPNATNENSKETFIKSHEVISIFHHKHHSYMIADGSFAGNNVIPLSDKVSDPEQSVQSTLNWIGDRILHHAIPLPADFEAEPEQDNESVEAQSTSAVHSSQSLETQERIDRNLFTSRLHEEIGKGKIVTDEVHFKEKGFLSKSTLSSLSPTYHWKIIKKNNCYSGEPIKWHEDCFIMHTQTRRFLSVSGSKPNYKLSLEDIDHSSEGPATFKLYPAVKQASTDKVSSKSYMRIRHTVTGGWLHLHRDNVYTSSDVEHQEYHRCISGKESNLYQIGLQLHINSNDVFVLSHVPNDLIAVFSTLADITALVSNQVENCSNSDKMEGCLPRYSISPFLSSLKYAKSITSSKKSSLYQFKQKCLKGLQILDLVITVLHFHSTEISCNSEVCAACFGILSSFLGGGSIQNQIYVSRRIPHLLQFPIWQTELVGEDSGIEHVLFTYAKNNSSFLYDSPLVTHVVNLLVKQLRNRKNQTHAIHCLKGLACFCSCKSTPIRENQDIILRKLHLEFSKRQKILCQLRVETRCGNTVRENVAETSIAMEDQGDSKEVQVLCYDEGLEESDGVWLGLSSKDVSEEKKTFLLEQIKLLGRLCQGNHKNAVKMLEGHQEQESIGVTLNFDTIREAMDDKYLQKHQPRIIAAMVTLMKAMYADAGEQRPILENIPGAKKISEVCHSTTEVKHYTFFPAPSLESYDSDKIFVIKQWIEKFFKELSKNNYAASEDGQNEAIVRVLQLLSKLIQYGHYRDFKDVKEWLGTLFHLLNGTNDVLFKDVKVELLDEFRTRSLTTEYFYEESRHRKSVDVSMLPQPSDLSKSLIAFKEKIRFRYSDDRKFYFKIKNWTMKILNHLFDLQLQQNLKNFIHDFWWLYNLENTSVTTKNQGIKMDPLQVLGVTPKGIMKGMKILLRSSPYTFAKGKETVSDPGLIDLVRSRLNYITKTGNCPDITFGELPNILLDLANYQDNCILQQSLLLLDRHYSTTTEVFQYSSEVHLMITDESVSVYDKINKLQSELRDYLQGNIKATAAIEILTDLCYLTDDVGEPHQINQKIITSFGILDEVLQYVLDLNAFSFQDTHTNKRKIFLQCIDLLKALSCKNLKIQERLAPHLDVLVKIAPTFTEPNVGLLISEIINSALSVCVDLKYEDLRKLFQYIVSKETGGSVEANSAFVQALLNSVVAADLDLVFKHNQTTVMKIFSIIREKDQYLCYDLLSGRAYDLRWTLLISESSSDTRIGNLLMLTDLLAGCAYGGIPAVLAHCKTVYSANELLRIIADRRINLYRRRPLIKFFVYVFMNGESGDEQIKQEHRMLLKPLEEFSSIIKKLNSFAKTEDSDESLLRIKKLLTLPWFKYFPERIQNDDFKESDILYADCILHLTEVIIPYLLSLSTYLNPKETYTDFDNYDEVYSSLLVFQSALERNWLICFSRLQIKKCYDVLSSMKDFTKSPLPYELQILQENSIKSSLMLQENCISPPRMEYFRVYASELQLNETFQKYVHNCQVSFEGRNTRKDQVLNQKVPLGNEIYSEFIDEQRLIPGPKFLPLGKSFQQKVNKFEFTQMQQKSEKGVLIKQIKVSHHNMKVASYLSISDAKIQDRLNLMALQIVRSSIYNTSIEFNAIKWKSSEIHKREVEALFHRVHKEIKTLSSPIPIVVSVLSNQSNKVVLEALAMIESLLRIGDQAITDVLVRSIMEDEEAFLHLWSVMLHTLHTYNEKKRITMSVAGKMSNNQVLGMTDIVICDSEYGINCALDLRIITFFYEVLGLFCSKQNKKMQHFLCEQSGSIKSINTIKELVTFYHKVMETELLDKDTLTFSIQLLKTLTGICAGNYKNCEVISEQNILQIFNQIFQANILPMKEGDVSCNSDGIGNNDKRSGSAMGPQTDDADFIVLQLQQKVAAINLLEVMVKKIHSNCDYLTQKIYRGLEIGAIHSCILEMKVLKKNPVVIQANLCDFTKTGLFGAFHICMYIADSKVAELHELEPEDENMKEAWDYCVQRSRSVEIVYRDEDHNSILTKVHFDLATKSNFSEEQRYHISHNIDRVSYGDKIRDFEKWTKAVKKDLLHKEKLMNSKVSLMTHTSDLRYYMHLLLTLILNIVVFSSFRAPDDSDAEQSTQAPSIILPVTIPELSLPVRVVLYLGGSLHLFLSIINFIDHLVVNLPHFVLPEYLYNIQLVPHWLQKYAVFKKLSELRILPQFQRTYFSVNIIGLSNIFVVILLCCSLLSLLFNGYFYTICLLYIVTKNEVLQRVLMAVYKSAIVLLWVTLFLLIIVGIYAVTAFAFFQHEFNDPSSPFFCSSLWECFTSVMRFGLLDTLLEVDTKGPMGAVSRLFFDVTFFFFIGIIGLNIVTGIIVDAFSELRDSKRRAEESIRSECFICEISSYHFDTLFPKGFITHISVDHNMWNYIHYFLYLDIRGTRNKPIGQYVKMKLKEKRIDFYPHKRALVLEEEESYEKKQLLVNKQNTTTPQVGTYCGKDKGKTEI